LFEQELDELGIEFWTSKRNHPQTNGKNERWFRTYEENRKRFKSFEDYVKWYNNKINLGLSRKEGITPNEAIINKLQPSAILGLFFRRID
jgi:putative transposase